MRGLWRLIRLIRLCLPSALYQQIVDDARATPELEICGLLAGSEHTCGAVYPIKNISPTPNCAFYMDPQMQIAAMAAMGKCGEQLLGIYHSHPTTAALPSARDVDGAAYPGIAYLIVSLENIAEPKSAAFVFERGTFSPIDLNIGAHNKT